MSRLPLPVFWILVAALVLRLALLVAVRDVGVHTDDERDYLQLAITMGSGGGFGFSSGHPTSIRPPLYPAFVAALGSVTGTPSIQVVRAAQMVVSLGSLLLLYALARRLFDDDVALWATAMWAVYPSFLYAGVLVLTEVLFTFLLLAGCLCGVLATTRPGGARGWAFAAGFAIGLAALTRSVLWPFPIVLVPVIALLVRGGIKGRLLTAGALAVGYTLAVAPWAVRNTALQKTFVVVDTMGGLNLRMGNYEYTREERMWDGVALSGEEAWSYAMVLEHPEATYWTEGQREKWARQRAVEYMAAHPMITIRRSVLKFADFWGLEREYVAAIRQGEYSLPLWFALISSAAMLLVYVGVMVLASVGLFLEPWRNWRVHVIPLLMLGWICGMHSVVFGHSRYHLPVMPILLIYAGAAVTYRSWRHRPIDIRRYGPAFATIAVLALIWAREVLFRDPERIRQLLQTVGL